MQLADEHISEFQKLYKGRFGIELAREEVLAKSAKLLRLMELVYRPMTEEEFTSLQERKLLLRTIQKEMDSLKNTANK
jgi:hypothetical protein